MAWHYHKRIKIIPGIHLNLSRNGISTSIGIKGASINIGKSGTYLNTSVPVLGIRNRIKLSEGEPLNYPGEYIPSHLTENIFSADVHEITSQNMQGIKEAIVLAKHQREELAQDLRNVRNVARLSKLKLNISLLMLLGIINKSLIQRIKSDLLAQQNAVKKIQEQIEQSAVSLDIELSPEIQERYNEVITAFKKLSTAGKIWDVTGAHYQDRVVARSSASTVVNRREVRFGIRTLPDIRSDFDVLYLQNANGADFYFYPAFIVMYASKNDFAIIGMDEVMVYHTPVRFTEESVVPSDSEIIDRTWAKVNKNGTPDKRFKGNYQIPVVRYGELNFKTKTGVNETYQCSNFAATEVFSIAFGRFQQIFKIGK